MSELSEKVTVLATNYLGPASKTFLERQTKAHMKGLLFEQLDKKDILELSRWVNISAALIIDKTKAEELSKKIAVL